MPNPNSCAENILMESSLNESFLAKALSVAKEAARVAGGILEDMLLSAAVHEKGPKDLVTDADIAAQRAIESIVAEAFPNHRFLGEESNIDYREFSTSQDWIWVVDPLDGTTNYVHRFPNFAVSIALVRESKVVLGVVYDPMSRELFSAVIGQGACLNDQSIGVSTCQNLDQAMVAASFPPQVRKDSPEVAQFLEILVRSQSVRRLGSAALNLCYVAVGRLDGYWANRLKPWDVAGGALIAAEAGACLQGLNGVPFSVWTGEVLVTSTESLGVEMQACLK